MQCTHGCSLSCLTMNRVLWKLHFANECPPFTQEDSQRYYRWQSFGPTDRRTQDLWVDLNALHKSQVQIHGILSNTHRQAAVRSTHTNITSNFTLGRVWHLFFSAEGGAVFWFPFLRTLFETDYRGDRWWVSLHVTRHHSNTHLRRSSNQEIEHLPVYRRRLCPTLGKYSSIPGYNKSS